ncbi:hypothetical protein [Actinomadura litoris]|uniref:hypothetical protein n=1 Tax=Actinomadura litoris TaxID=2678616 RepID=UPI001FA74C6C|nr:hypothetical protein [Actinomadura litoris]
MPLRELHQYAWQNSHAHGKPPGERSRYGLVETIEASTAKAVVKVLSRHEVEQACGAAGEGVERVKRARHRPAGQSQGGAVRRGDRALRAVSL